MKIGVIGLGDLGLTNVALFASYGYEIIAFDNNAFQVSLLNKGIKIFKDDRVKDIIFGNKKRIFFTSDISNLFGVEIVVITTDLDCVNGEYNLNSFYQIIDKIKNNFNWKTTLIIKTPLPMGTCRAIDKYLNDHKENFYIAYMPLIELEKHLYENEFMPSVVIVGTISPHAHTNVRILYEKFLLDGRNIYFLSYEEAEMYRIAKSILNITYSQYVTEMQCLYNEFNLNMDTLLSTLKIPEVNSEFLGNGKRIIGEYNNLNFFLRRNHSFNKSLEEINLELAYQIISRIPDNIQTIGIFGISDNSDEINRLVIDVIEILLAKSNCSIIIYDQLNEINLKKLIGTNKKLKYALDEKSLVKKSDAVLILCENELFKTINEDFYIKYGKENLIVCDFIDVYKYCKWQKVNLIKMQSNKRHIYKEIINNEKVPQ